MRNGESAFWMFVSNRHYQARIDFVAQVKKRLPEFGQLFWQSFNLFLERQTELNCSLNFEKYIFYILYKGLEANKK